ncbi:MAG: IS1595 family transposase [Candidatus Saelkia tenebricola]|nr:IS1595 family transposase [Candidatus Saelkia tenebricola]
MKYTIKNFQKEFPNDDVCLDHLFAQRFEHLADFNKYYRVSNRKCYAHSETGEQIHPLAGTIFHKSSTKLTLWFYAIFLFSQSKNGISAKELERHLGVTYKCAWRMAKQIRELMQQKPSMFTGTVEADETYVGGKGKNNKRGRGAENKTPVVGIVERGGSVVAKATTNVKASTVMPLIRENVKIGANLMTDEYNIYNKAGLEYNHQTIQHGAKEYVRGDVHTNTIEGFWSQLKRSIDGTFHSVSPKYLQAYVNEFAFRYNHRNSSLHLFQILSGKI